MKHSSTPQCKRFSRNQRLDSAKAWLASYSGDNMVRSYRKHFGVDWHCAFIELDLLGIRIPPEYKEQVLQSVNANAEDTKRKKAQRETRVSENIHDDRDERFAFIAGHTPAGYPYGVTWEEMGESDSPPQP